jgi:preprotein translocase subunit SecF
MIRLNLVPSQTSLDFFRFQRFTFGASLVAMVLSLAAFLLIGLNFGIDFRGGTSIRTEAVQPVDVGAYRSALGALGLGDVAITEVFDPSFGPQQNVAMIRIQAQEGQESVTPAVIEQIRVALVALDPSLRFTAVESVGPKVSGELIRGAIIAVGLALLGILFYVWVRFEWQFAVGAVAALVHDVVLTIGIFSVLQIRFDLAIIAALLTIVGYSLNDTVVVFDRVRENLIKYKKRPLREVMNLSINETLSRTVMTSATTLLALLALFVLGGDVMRGFVFAMIWGVVVGTYSSVFMASTIVLFLGLRRDPSRDAGDGKPGTQFATSEKA